MPEHREERSLLPLWMLSSHTHLLLAWPLLNLLTVLMLMVLVDSPILNADFYGVLTGVGKMLWSIFALFWLFIQLARRYLPFWPRLRHVVARGLVYVGFILLAFYVARNLWPLEFIKSNPKYVFFGSLNLSLQVIIYLALGQIIYLRERSFAIKTQAKQNEIQMLKSQNNPHFLFNTLNLIAVEIDERPEVAKELIYDLSDLLRSTLRLSDQPLIELKQELKIIELYLKLQQIRFGERLSYDIDNTVVGQKLLIPPLLLLPLVENAIKYAVAPYKNLTRVKVSVDTVDDKVLIEIRDSGPQFDVKQLTWGQGLSVLDKTLQLHYGHSADFTLRSNTFGALLSLTIPVKQLGGYDE